ncbi:SN protein, partial [Chauna torquata]|nr:SN protein [Chauna torquata]
SKRCALYKRRGVVSIPHRSPLSAARVLVVPSAEVLEGDDVSLTCEVPGEPGADTVFSWYKDSKHVQESPDRVLALPHVASAAAGSYHCKAHSPSGAGTSVSPAVSLRVLCEWGGEQRPRCP